MTLPEMLDAIRNRASHQGITATRVRVDGGAVIFSYHDTDIVRFDRDYIRLNNGGWMSTTTKGRMNQIARAFDLPFDVSQRKHKWYVGSASYGNVAGLPTRHIVRITPAQNDPAHPAYTRSAA